MALREGRCLLDRRFADRGNDIKVFYSRARGEYRRPTRRVAERGSDGVYHDPRDLKEIRRLCQRVRDLEEIRRLRHRVRDLEKIRRLRHRVQDLELQRERHDKETESGTIVWDDVNEEEEHPFDHTHPRFDEPIYQECLYKDKPIFDEDKIEPGEEEYSFVQMVLSGVTVQGESRAKEVAVYPKMSADIMNGNHDDEPVFKFFHVECNKGGGTTVITGGPTTTWRTRSASMVSPPFMPKEMLGLNVDAKITGFQIGGVNSNIQKINVASYVADIVGMCDHVHGDNLFGKNEANTRLQASQTGSRGIANGEPISFIKNCKSPLPYSPIGPLYLSNAYGGPCKVSKGEQHTKNAMEHCDGGLINAHCKLNRSIHSTYPLYSKLAAQTCVEVKQAIGPKTLIAGKKMGQLVLEWLANKIQLNNPFDPGGTGFDPREMTREVGLFRRVLMIVQKNRVDVPYDPGGFGTKTKLEDEFFSKRGRMMRCDPTCEED